MCLVIRAIRIYFDIPNVQNCGDDAEEVELLVGTRTNRIKGRLQLEWSANTLLA